MKKYASVGIGLLSVVFALAMMAAPADARAHRHHRHHRHGGGGGGGITCGPGTVNVGGVCTPTAPAGPVGNGNVNINPSSITMNLNGSFSGSVVVSGLPPLIPVTVTPFSCGTTTVLFTVTSPGGAPDALGRLQAVIGSFGGCVPGSYPIVFTETASPFQSFTGFINLHF